MRKFELGIDGGGVVARPNAQDHYLRRPCDTSVVPKKSPTLVPCCFYGYLLVIEAQGAQEGQLYSVDVEYPPGYRVRLWLTEVCIEMPF